MVIDILSGQPWLVIVPLVAGWLLDLLIGDPLWMPHPIRWFGHTIAQTEKYLNRGRYRRLKGLTMAVVLICVAYSSFWGIVRLADFSVWIYYPVASWLVFWGLANRNLIDEAKRVEHRLSREGLEAGRHQLSFIVGRDTSNLSPKQIRTAVLETLSENLNDGVVAPLFYYAIGGIPLMFAYKMVNTLDSMVGYKSDRYRLFGWFAAKTDDVANFIPARITALVTVLVTLSGRGAKFILKYGHQHASPNSGYPEAALAGILNCRFGGPNVYHGKLVEKPFIGNCDREVTSGDIRIACLLNQVVTAVVIAIILILKYSFGI
jgi:adenosylcobinamide-phosphate synthase